MAQVYCLLLLALIPLTAAGSDPTTLNVTCVVGLDEPIKWMHDDIELIMDDKNYLADERQVNDTAIEAILVVKQPNKNGMGSYKCNKKRFAKVLQTNSKDSIQGIYNDTNTQMRFFDVDRELVLGCQVDLQPQRAFELEWEKMVNVPENNVSEYKPVNDIEQMKNRIIKTSTNQLIIKQAKEEDAGKYRCSVSDSNLVAVINTATRIRVKLPKDQMVVEAEKLKITCVTHGNPVPTVTWLYVNSTYNATYEESSGRVILENGENGAKNAILTVQSAEKYDAGKYTCMAYSVSGVANATVTVRIKDKLAALWPFLGICAEVFILCAIILVYEKRRNTPTAEHDDSDTDHSPDRKK